MFFDWQEILVMWVAFGGIWSLSLIGLIMVLGYVGVKRIMTPSNKFERESYLATKENARSEKTVARRYAEVGFIWVFNFIITVSFLVIIYKIFV